MVALVRAADDRFVVTVPEAGGDNRRGVMADAVADQPVSFWAALLSRAFTR